MIVSNRNRGPKMLFTISLVSIPAFTISARKNTENRWQHFKFFENSFEEHMEWFPIARRAFNRAMKIKEDEISELEKELAKKEEMLANLTEPKI